MFAKIIVLCTASASLLYTIMYAAVSSYYHKTSNQTSGISKEERY